MQLRCSKIKRRHLNWRSAMMSGNDSKKDFWKNGLGLGGTFPRHEKVNHHHHHHHHQQQQQQQQHQQQQQQQQQRIFFFESILQTASKNRKTTKKCFGTWRKVWLKYFFGLRVAVSRRNNLEQPPTYKTMKTSWDVNFFGCFSVKGTTKTKVNIWIKQCDKLCINKKTLYLNVEITETKDPPIHFSRVFFWVPRLCSRFCCRSQASLSLKWCGKRTFWHWLCISIWFLGWEKRPSERWFLILWNVIPGFWENVVLGRHILVLVGGYSRVVRSFFCFQLFVIHCCWASGETDRVFCLGKGDSERTNSLTSRNKFIIRRKAFQHVGEVYV